MAKLDLVVDVDVKGDKIKGLQSTLGNVAKIGAGIAVGGIAIGGVFTKMAADAETSQTELESVFKSMRANTFTTIDALNEQATAMAAATTFDDDSIKRAQSTLLTFGEIGAESFELATASALDMSQFFGTDLRQSSVQLGKALNDPIKGIGSLARIGIKLSDVQQQQVKDFVAVGDIASAQGIILGEVQRQVGDVAEDAAGTTAGMLEQAQNQLGEVGEAFGAAILPVLKEILPGLIEGLRGFAAWVTENMPTIQGIMGTVFGAIGSAIQFLATTIIPAVGAVFNWLATNIFPALSGAASNFGTNILPTIIGAFQSIFAWVTANWPTISSVIGQAIGAVVNAVQVAWPIIERIATVLFPIISTAASILFKALDFTFKLIGGVFEVVGNVVETMVDVISGAWNFLSEVTSNIWTGLGEIIKGAINIVIGLINGFIGFINGIQVHIPPLGIGPVATPAFDWWGLNLPMIPQLASGGIVTKPTLAVIGESGREAVIPLGHGTPGMGNNFVFHIQSPIPDEKGIVSLVERSQRLTRMMAWD